MTPLYVVVAFQVEGHPDWRPDAVRRAVKRIVAREAGNAVVRVSGLDVGVREIKPPRKGNLAHGQMGDHGKV